MVVACVAGNLVFAGSTHNLSRLPGGRRHRGPTAGGRQRGRRILYSVARGAAHSLVREICALYEWLALVRLSHERPLRHLGSSGQVPAGRSER